MDKVLYLTHIMKHGVCVYVCVYNLELLYKMDHFIEQVDIEILDINDLHFFCRKGIKNRSNESLNLKHLTHPQISNSIR